MQMLKQNRADNQTAKFKSTKPSILPPWSLCLYLAHPVEYVDDEEAEYYAARDEHHLLHARERHGGAARDISPNQHLKPQ